MSAPVRPTDGELYSSFLDGDTIAYDQLMIRYGDSLTTYLFGCLHDWQDAEDLMIDSFAWIMVKRPGIQDGAFKAYLFRTSRSLACSFLRKKRAHQEFSTDGIEKEAAEAVSAGEEIWSAERSQALSLCLDRIEPELKEALWLVYIEGMTYAQAASVMGVKVKRIDRLLARGKQQMRKELEKEGVTNAYE